MDFTLLIGLIVCTLGGFILGHLIGVVLGFDLARSMFQRKPEEDALLGPLDDWNEDLADPEGVWNA